MLPSPGGVPVSVEVSPAEVLHGIFTIEGSLCFADQMLTIAYRMKGVRRQASVEETLHLPLEALQEVELKGRVGVAKIVLRPRHLGTLAKLPWAAPEAIVFQVKRKHRRQAAALVARLQHALAESAGEDPASIPFQLPGANLGLTEIKGLLYLDEAFLVFEVGTGLPGGVRRKRQTIKIEPRALEVIRLDRGAFVDQLSIRPKERDLFRVMPGMYKGKQELVLKVAKKYRPAAARLVEEVRRRAR